VMEAAGLVRQEPQRAEEPAPEPSGTADVPPTQVA
jgi:hypothetical protein